MILAQAPDVPWPVTSNFVFGLLGLLGAIWLVLAVVIQVKKLFGRQPPLNQELDERDKRLRNMIFAAEKNLKEEQARQLELIAKLEEQYAEMQADRIRKWEELQRQIFELSSHLSFIRGKFEKDQR